MQGDSCTHRISKGPDISIAELFQREGSFGQLAALYGKRKPFAWIERNVHVSKSTFSTRLSEASKLGFVDQTRGAWKGRTTSIYLLTAYGDAIANELAGDGVFRDNEKIYELMQRVEAARIAIVKEIYDNPAEYFTYGEVHEAKFIISEEGIVIEEVYSGKTVDDQVQDVERATLAD